MERTTATAWEESMSEDRLSRCWEIDLLGCRVWLYGCNSGTVSKLAAKCSVRREFRLNLVTVPELQPYYRSAKENSDVPAATEMYCRPLTE